MAREIEPFTLANGLDIPCVLFDYSVYPMQATIGSVVSNRPKTYVSIPYSRCQWDYLVEEVRRACRRGEGVQAVTTMIIPENPGLGSRSLFSAIPFQYSENC
ncbi:hypothetical protein PLICRDRAFT_38791 [Plicaturopsis crispa FD-325 SS-3]|nr:hypothetical protein PLICRDRAFT_38791 [Plicaturopsis crispa FD-325 SS-3]